MEDEEEIDIKFEVYEDVDLDQEEAKVEHDAYAGRYLPGTFTTIDEVEIEEDDAGDDLDESEIFIDYKNFYSPADLEMRDPLKEVDNEDESAWCTTPRILKRRKLELKTMNGAGSQQINQVGSSTLEEHLRTETNRLKIFDIPHPQPFKFATCEKSFPRMDGLVLHVERGHPFTCPTPTCSSTFDATGRSRNVHLKTAHAAYECSLCPRKFNQASSLAMHMVIRHETGEKKFPCDKCTKSFALEENFRRHVDLHEIEGEKPIVCDVCDSRFEDDAGLQRHVAMHHPFICDQCGIPYVKRARLQRHICVVHMGEKPAKCEQCEESFITKVALDRHVGLVHSVSHVYNISGNSFRLQKKITYKTCATCGEKFAGCRRLTTHQIREHGADPWTCPECGATFVNHSGFKLHMMGHRGERPHKCDLCDARFPTRGKMQNHRRTHSEERPFACPHCEYAFKVKHGLSKHIKGMHTQAYVTPTPHRCPHCEKGFKIVSALEGHVRQVHTGERPFVCDQDACGKAFAQKTSLIQHLMGVHKVGERKSRFKLPSRKILGEL